MKKITLIAMLALLLVPAVAFAQPPAGCTWDGDPAFIYGWGYLDGLDYNQPGPDYATIWKGYSLTYQLGPYNASDVWLPSTCKALDTLCFHATSSHGWALTCDPEMGLPQELDISYLWYQIITITAPCVGELPVGMQDTIIAICAYTNNLGVCDPSCGDCNDPNLRPSTGLYHYSADTLIITVVEAPVPLEVLQDTLTLVEQGQTAAYVPFAICNGDYCAPVTRIDYVITTTGHVPTTINNGYLEMLPGTCEDIYAILNAGEAALCTYDTLQIVVWTGDPATYDTCVQVIHVVEAQEVPLFTVPVVTILVLALILAAAVFMRRRAAARA